MSDEEKSVDKIVREVSEEADKTTEIDLHDDRTREFSHLSQSRMARTSWRPEDKEAMSGIHAVIDRLLLEHYSDAYQVMNELYEIVREPQVLEGGVIAEDQYGFTVWARTESGAFVEDYSKLGYAEVKDLLFKITTRLFAWEQSAAQLHGDAMYAKALWEASYAEGYNNSRLSGGKTVEDRMQAAREASMDDRFFGLFQANLSRRADALVRSMTLLSQRLKDVLSS